MIHVRIQNAILIIIIYVVYNVEYIEEIKVQYNVQNMLKYIHTRKIHIY